MRVLKLFVSLLILAATVTTAKPAQAAEIVVFGEALSGFSLSSIDDFYDSLPGMTSTIAAGPLDTVDLTGVELLWATQPADDYTVAELMKMADYLSAGGRIAFMGEHGTFAPDENTRINTALAFLGADIIINNVTVDPGFRSASVADGQILAHPLTAGVNTYEYAAFAPLTISGTAQSLMLGENLLTIMMAYQNIGPGSIFLITDQNVWDNQPSNWGAFDNEVMFENLVAASTDPTDPTTVPEPATLTLLGVGLSGLVAARKRKLNKASLK